MASRKLDRLAEAMHWDSVAEIPNFPFKRFAELQSALGERSYSLGVDALEAAQWASEFAGPFRRSLIGALSILLALAAIASIVVALAIKNYWLLAAVPVQALAFYLSHPSSRFRTWVTIGGVASGIVFLDLLLGGLPTAATLVAYAGLTFAAVRAAALINSSAFRKALASDESLFLAAYGSRACTVRDNKAKRVYAAPVRAA